MDFFSKCDQIRSFLRISSYFLKKSVTENLILSAASSGTFFERGWGNSLKRTYIEGWRVDLKQTGTNKGRGSQKLKVSR